MRGEYVLLSPMWLAARLTNDMFAKLDPRLTRNTHVPGDPIPSVAVRGHRRRRTMSSSGGGGAFFGAAGFFAFFGAAAASAASSPSAAAFRFFGAFGFSGASRRGVDATASPPASALFVHARCSGSSSSMPSIAPMSSVTPSQRPSSARYSAFGGLKMHCEIHVAQAVEDPEEHPRLALGDRAAVALALRAARRRVVDAQVLRRGTPAFSHFVTESLLWRDDARTHLALLERFSLQRWHDERLDEATSSVGLSGATIASAQRAVRSSAVAEQIPAKSTEATTTTRPPTSDNLNCVSIHRDTRAKNASSRRLDPRAERGEGPGSLRAA